MRITLAAPSKVNLWLRVGAARSDGYHELDTLFCALALADDVMLRPGEAGRGIRLGLRHAPPLTAPPDLGPIQRNLAMRAARAFQRLGGGPPDLRLSVVKRIPAGGGLGGGSSDAAAVLRGLRRMYPELVDGAQVAELALSLGSDVPFFVAGQPLAHGAGRGERLTPLEPLPSRSVVAVLPPFPVATSEAYRWLDEGRETGALPPAPDPAEAAPPTAAPSWETVEAAATNDFEAPVFARHPVLGRIRDLLEASGASVARMAGTGSTVFGVFAEEEAARYAAGRLGREHPAARIVVTTTRIR